jgi:hypothetical protein
VTHIERLIVKTVHADDQARFCDEKTRLREKCRFILSSPHAQTIGNINSCDSSMIEQGDA